MTFEAGKSGNPGGRPKNVQHVRLLARTHTDEAINTLVHWMRSRGAKMGHVSIAAASALIERGWGRAALDPEAGEQITITIRKILEIGAPQQAQHTNGKVIDHEPSVPADDIIGEDP